MATRKPITGKQPDNIQRFSHGKRPLVLKHRRNKDLPVQAYRSMQTEFVWKAYIADKIARHAAASAAAEDNLDVPAFDNPELRNILVERYLELAMQQAGTYFSRNMPSYSLSEIYDLKGDAIFGLIDAVKTYNPLLGVPFEAYLNLKVRGSIIDGLRRMQDFPRIIAKWRRDLKPMMESLHQKLRHKPSADEFCKEYGEDFRGILDDPLFRSGVFNQLDGNSGDSDGGDKTNVSILDTIEDYRKQPDLDNTEMIDAETRILSIFDEVGRPDLRVVIYGYYFMRCTNQQIAMANGYSVATACNKHKEALMILRHTLTRRMFCEIIGKIK